MCRNNLVVVMSFVFCMAFQDAYTQTSTNSPYSQYGIGDIESQVFGQGKALGSSAFGIRSKMHLNSVNPASYTALDSMSFLFEFGLRIKTMTLSDQNNKDTLANSNMHYLAMGFPITRWWCGSIGLIPFSNMGYYMKDSANEAGIGPVTSYFSGSGGIDKFYFGNAFKINHKISAGLNIGYLFGSLRKTRTIIIDEASYDTQHETNSRIGDFYFDLGIQYTDIYKERYKYTLGLIYNHNTKLNVKNNILAGSLVNADYLTIQNQDLVDTAIFVEDMKTSITIPAKIGFGASLSQGSKWLIATDFYYQNWAKAEFFGERDSLAGFLHYGVGGEYTPAFKSRDFFKRLSYRAGLYYSNSYIEINNVHIKDFGLSLGLGIPLDRYKTSLNISYEYGQRGTHKNNLIKENYHIVSINLSLADIWFVKRKFD